jgi:1,4-dihydroxy-2-naphthoate octaprenyltransferase
MNVAMWKRALKVIPSVNKTEWEALDLVSKWLISSRAAVLIMTALPALMAGLYTLHDGQSVDALAWLVLTLGLVLSHAMNNMVNDFTDFVRGVDVDNYFRTMYGPQPVADGLLTKRQHLTYITLTGAAAIACGVYLILTNGNDPVIWTLLGLGLFFVFFYTWPLKYIALGEVAVFIVWGPLMIGGGYYVLAHHWNWNVIGASLPYVLGVTTVIFGKHIDKLPADKAKRIFTLPALIGEKAARFSILAMMTAPYLLVLGLIGVKYFTPAMLVVFLAVPTTVRLFPLFLKPRPETRPEGFPDGEGGWPLYFAPTAFENNRAFGLLFLVGLTLDVVLRVVPATTTFWR